MLLTEVQGHTPRMRRGRECADGYGEDRCGVSLSQRPVSTLLVFFIAREACAEYLPLPYVLL
jgi:hypothetical protein